MDTKERRETLFRLDYLAKTKGFGLLTGGAGGGNAIHEPLYQRLVMNYNLEGLSKEEGPPTSTKS